MPAPTHSTAPNTKLKNPPRSTACRRITPPFALRRKSAARGQGPPRRFSSSATRVVAARTAGVTRARALHHAAALLAGGAEGEALHLRRDHRRRVGEGRGGGDRFTGFRLGRLGAVLGGVAVATVAVAAVDRPGGVGSDAEA